MKKTIALLGLLPTAAFAHTGLHSETMLQAMHFLTEADHIAMVVFGFITVGFIAVGFIAKK